MSFVLNEFLAFRQRRAISRKIAALSLFAPMNLHVYVGDGYSFFITVDAQQQIEKAIASIEQQLNYLY